MFIDSLVSNEESDQINHKKSALLKGFFNSQNTNMIKISDKFLTSSYIRYLLVYIPEHF